MACIMNYFKKYLLVCMLPATALSMQSGEASSARECRICFESIGGAVVSSDALFGCHHEGANWYHDVCMAQWLHAHGLATTCLFCRAHLLPNVCGRFFPLAVRRELAAAYAADAGQAAVDASIYNVNFLMRSAKSGNAVSVVLCLDHGVAINARDGRGRTALMTAARHGRAVAVHALLEHHDIDVCAQAVDGSTALILAALHGHHAVVQALLGHPAIDVNAQDVHGRTALIAAALNGRSTVVWRLLAHHGIDVNLRDHEGRTALAVAQKREIRDALIAHGAQPDAE